MSKFYARNGDEITLNQWSKLLGDRKYKRVALKRFKSGRWVSTVWLGMDHSFSFGDGPHIPIIFETMVFDGDGWSEEYTERYATEEEAREGHARIVEMVRVLENVEQQEEVDHDEQSTRGDA